MSVLTPSCSALSARITTSANQLKVGISFDDPSAVASFANILSNYYRSYPR